MFLVWGFAIAAATYQLTSFIRGTIKMIELERAKQDPNVLKIVKGLIEEYDKDKDGDIDEDEIDGLLWKISDDDDPATPNFTQSQVRKIKERLKTINRKYGNGTEGIRDEGTGICQRWKRWCVGGHSRLATQLDPKEQAKALRGETEELLCQVRTRCCGRSATKLRSATHDSALMAAERHDT